MIILNPPQKTNIDQRVDQFFPLCEEVIYISGAITTGINYINWYNNKGKRIENKDEFRKNRYLDVTSKNIDVIIKFTESLKGKWSTTIIEPASLEVAGWTQPDYWYYWGQIITKFVKKIVFMDGWGYSNGCVYEYYMGIEKGIELVDQNFQLLDRATAISQIEESIEKYKEFGINATFQQTVLNELKNGKSR